MATPLRRDWATLADYRDNLHAAQLGPIPPDLLRLRQALRAKPVDATQYFLARDGRIPRDDFFSPRNIARILETAVVA